MANMSLTAGMQQENRAPIGATKESLWDVITTIDPLETYVSSNAPTVAVQDIQYSWSQQAPRTPASRSQVEGADPTYDNTVTSRDSNWTQIISVAHQLSGSRKQAATVGGDPMARERNLSMKAWKNALEFDLIRGTLVTGNDSTPRKMKGMKAFASTLLTTQSGKTLTEDMFNDYMGGAWDKGVEIDTVLVGRVLKRGISKFTAGNTKNVDASDDTIYGRVDVYDGDFGRQRIIKHRFVTQSGDANYDLLGYDSGYVHVGMYRMPKMEPLAKTGDADQEQVIGEVTLQVDNEKAIFLAKAHVV